MLALAAALAQSVSLAFALPGGWSASAYPTSTVSEAPAQPEKPAQPPAEPAKQPEKTEPTTDPKKDPAADPSTEDIMREMEKQRGNAPAPAPSAPAPAAPGTSAPTPQPGAPATRMQTPSGGRLLREGTFLVERRGRMVRSPGGEWLYTFDADAQGQADPTMSLIPCQRLEQMEKLAERYGESLTFTVTGQVFVYHNRNFFLPATFKANRANVDIKTTQ